MHVGAFRGRYMAHKRVRFAKFFVAVMGGTDIVVIVDTVSALESSSFALLFCYNESR